MASFKEKAVKWDGDDGNGRYKNKSGFKFDIITKKVVHRLEEMPRCFLADTPEEAQAIYFKFESLLNNMAYTYAVSSNVDKADLFGDALIGLARAYRDWDSSRSENFKNYAIYRIKDALNECVRINGMPVSVPSYIKKAHSNLENLKRICEMKGIDWTFIKEPSKELFTTDDDLNECVAKIRNAASRAGVSIDKFIERIEYIPTDADYTEQILVEKNESQLEAAIVVNQIKQEMNEEEEKICDGIMQGKTYEEIGAEFGRSKAWVAGKLKGLRERIIEKARKEK